MRTALTAVFFSLVAGCVGVVDAPGNTQPGGDDQGGDDDTGGTPSLNVALDKTSFSTELNSQNVATVTLTGAGGFSGAVSLTASVVDDAGATLSDWTVALDTASVTLGVNGTATAKATVKIPAITTNMAGKLSIAATAAGVTVAPVTSTLSAANQVTFVMTSDAAGKCVYPSDRDATVSAATTVKSGTVVRFLNATDDANFKIRIHSSDNAGTASGIAHEQVDTSQNDMYVQTASATAQTTIGWYCHTPGNDPGTLKITIMP